MIKPNNHIKLHGLAICIETPKGQRRRPDWPEMPADYGYIKKTEGADGDAIDCFVGPHRHSEMVYVVDQCSKDGTFDEHKVMLGYTNYKKALEAVRSAYSKGCKIGKITAMTIGQFKEWMKAGDKRSAIKDQVSRYSQNMVPARLGGRPIGTGSFAPVPSLWAEHAVGRDPRIATTEPEAKSTWKKNPWDMSLTEFSNVHGQALPKMENEHAWAADKYIENNFGPFTQDTFNRTRNRNPVARSHLRHIAHAMANGIPVHPDAIGSYHQDILGSASQQPQRESDQYANNVIRSTAVSRNAPMSESDAIRALHQGKDVFHGGVHLKASEWADWMNAAKGYTLPSQDVASQALSAFKNFRLYQKDLATPKLLKTNAQYGDEKPKQPIGPIVGPKESEDHYAQASALGYAQGTPRHTNSEAFKQWFGQSKVVGKDGTPLTVYHGTSNASHQSLDPYQSKFGLFGPGSYFTEDPDIASEYTEKGKSNSMRQGAHAPGVYPVHLAINNPMDMDGPADHKNWLKGFREYFGDHDLDELHSLKTNKEVFGMVKRNIQDYEPFYTHADAMEAVQNGMHRMGHDGLTHIGGAYRSKDGKPHRVWVAYHPHQIKSATGNRGTFSADSDNMNYSVDQYEFSLVAEIDRYAGKNQLSFFDKLSDTSTQTPRQPLPSATAPVQQVLKPSKMATPSLFDQPLKEPSVSTPDAAAPPSMPLEGKAKQKNLFDIHGNPSQMLMFGDKASPDTLEKRMADPAPPAAEPVKEKQRGKGLGGFMRGEKSVVPTQRSAGPSVALHEDHVQTGGDGSSSNDEMYNIVRTIKEKEPISLDEFKNRHYKAILSSMLHQHDATHPLRILLSDLEKKYPAHYEHVSRLAELGLRDQIDRKNAKAAPSERERNPLVGPEHPDHDDHHLELFDDRRSELDRKFEEELNHPGLRPFLLQRAKEVAGGDHQAAEDIVQNAMIAATKSRHTYDPGQPFQTWMATIVRRQAANAVRDRNRKKRGGGKTIEAMDAGGSEEGQGLHDIIGSGVRKSGDFSVEPDELEALRKHVKNLPPDQQEAMGHFMQGHSKADIARRIKQSEAIVGRRINAALATLKEKFKSQDKKNYALEALIERYRYEEDREYYAMCQRVYRYSVFGEVDRYADPLKDPSDYRSMPSRFDRPQPTSQPKDLGPAPGPTLRMHTGEEIAGRPDKTDPSNPLHIGNQKPHAQLGDFASHLENVRKGLDFEWASAQQQHQNALRTVGGQKPLKPTSGMSSEFGDMAQAQGVNVDREPDKTPHDYVRWDRVRDYLGSLNQLHRQGLQHNVNIANVANYNGTIPQWLVPKLAGGRKFFDPSLLGGKWKTPQQTQAASATQPTSAPQPSQQRPAWNDQLHQQAADAKRYVPHATESLARTAMAEHQQKNPQGRFDVVQHPNRSWYVGQWVSPQEKQAATDALFSKLGQQKNNASGSGVAKPPLSAPLLPGTQSPATQAMMRPGAPPVQTNAGQPSSTQPQESQQQPDGTIHLGSGVYMVPRKTAAGVVSPVHFADGREMVNLRDQNGKDSWFYRSFTGTGGKQQGQWYPVGGVANMKGGRKWIIKGDTSNDPYYGRPELQKLAETANAILPKSDQEMDQFLNKHLKRSDGARAINDESLQARGVDFPNHEHGNQDHFAAILNTWKDQHLNKVWGRRVESQQQPQNPAAASSAPAQSQPQPVPASRPAEFSRFNYRPARPFDPNADTHHLQALFPGHPAVTPEVMKEFDDAASKWTVNNPSIAFNEMDAIARRISNTDPRSVQPAAPKAPPASAPSQPTVPRSVGDVNQELLGLKQSNEISDNLEPQEESRPNAQSAPNLSSSGSQPQPRAPGSAQATSQNQDNAHESVPVVSDKEFANGDWDKAHEGLLPSLLVAQKVAHGMRGIDNRQYGVWRRPSGQHQLISKPMGSTNQQNQGEFTTITKQIADAWNQAFANRQAARQNPPVSNDGLDDDTGEWDRTVDDSSFVSSEPDPWDTEPFPPQESDSEKKKIDEPKGNSMMLSLPSGGIANVAFPNRHELDLANLGLALRTASGKRKAETINNHLYNAKLSLGDSSVSHDELKHRAQFSDAYLQYLSKHMGANEQISHPGYMHTLADAHDITVNQFSSMLDQAYWASSDYLKEGQLLHSDMLELIDRSLVENKLDKEQIDRLQEAQATISPETSSYNREMTAIRARNAFDKDRAFESERHAILQNPSLGDDEMQLEISKAKERIDKEFADRLRSSQRRSIGAMAGAKGREVRYLNAGGDEVDDVLVDRLLNQYPDVVAYLVPGGESIGNNDLAKAEEAYKRLRMEKFYPRPFEEILSRNAKDMSKAKQMETEDTRNEDFMKLPFSFKASELAYTGAVKYLSLRSSLLTALSIFGKKH